MAVLPFVRPDDAQAPMRWTAEELTALERLVGLTRARGARTWEAANTEEGDPQFYVLSGEPDQRCVAAVSRLRGRYILEDGEGCVLAERASLAELIREAGVLFRSRRVFPFTARVSLAFFAARSALYDKVPELEESCELLAVLV